MAIDQTDNSSQTISWGRGDSRAKEFQIKDVNGVVVDISGFTFKLTCNTNRNPTVSDGTELFTLTGVITDASDGRVAFAPTIVQTDQTPGTYYYDIQMVDAGGGIETLFKALLLIEQDITK